jgi:CRP/FNR family transcriptional regulator, cyclic AMP receptor protein
MTTKSSPSMMRRYSGAAGRQQLISALCIQPVVAGEIAIAQQLIAHGKFLDIRPGKILIQQGNADNDLYLIVSGEVGISINGREIAIRGAGCHVGEMALLDPTARRSASVIARERTVALRIAEADVKELANQYPEFWRRLAVELAARLRQRSRFIPEPNATPVIFVGSSNEALTEATWLSDSLNRRPVVSRLWTQGVFQLSKTTIEDLMCMAIKCDYAALLLTPDDMTASRGKKEASPRDNVVFELGLFMGALGRERTFIIASREVDLKLPTDLLGMTHMHFKKGSNKTVGKRLSPVARFLWNRIQQLGAR